MSDEKTNIQKLIDAGILDGKMRKISAPLSKSDIEAINQASKDDIDALIRLRKSPGSTPEPNIF